MDPSQPARPTSRPRRLLSPEGLFRIVAEEAFRDGVLEGWEAKILQILARFLGLKPETAMGIAHRARQAHQQGKLGEARPLEPSTLYRKVLYFTCHDGRIEESEGQMLLALRKLFKISEEEHTRLFQQVAMHFRKRSDSLSGEIDLAALEAAAHPGSPDQSWGQDVLRRATSLARALDEGMLDERDETDSVQLLEELGEALPRVERHPALLRTLAVLAPVLAQRGRSKQLLALLVETLRPRNLWAEQPEALRKLVQGWTLPILATQDPDRRQGLVETLWGLTRLGTPDPVLWNAVAFGLFQVSKYLASHREWDAHLELMLCFRAVPDAFLPAVAPAWAEAAADWVVLGLHSGVLYAADRGLHELKLLASYRDQPGVRRAEATAVTCLLQTFSEEDRLSLPDILRALERARDLRQAFPDDAEVLRPQLLVTLETARALLDLDQTDACGDLFRDLGEAVCRFPREQGLLFELTKAVLATTHHRLQSLPPEGRASDPLLPVLKQVMADLRGASPGTPVVEAAGRRHQALLENLGI